MAADRTEMDELVEERPVPGALVRHRGARLVQHGVERSAPRLEVHDGAVWLRATASGPGVLASHGATTVQVREGAAVLEVDDFEALLVVVSGRAAVKGAAALPRSVPAGHAVTLNLDGGFGSPEPITAAELQADRFVVENLARDVLAEAEAAPIASAEGRSEPDPGPLAAPAEVRVDGSPPTVATPEPGPPTAPPTAAAEPPDEGSGRVYDPEPLAVPRAAGWGGATSGDGDEPAESRPARRGLIAVVLVLVLLAAVIGAVVLTGDAVRSTPPTGDPVPASADASAGVEPEATLQRCEAGSSGYVAQGVVSGGGDDVAQYRVGVGLEDADGTLYAEKAVTVDARADPSVEVRWTIDLALSADEIRPDSECRLIQVDAI